MNRAPTTLSLLACWEWRAKRKTNCIRGKIPANFHSPSSPFPPSPPLPSLFSSGEKEAHPRRRLRRKSLLLGGRGVRRLRRDLVRSPRKPGILIWSWGRSAGGSVREEGSEVESFFSVWKGRIVTVDHVRKRGRLGEKSYKECVWWRGKACDGDKLSNVPLNFERHDNSRLYDDVLFLF